MSKEKNLWFKKLKFLLGIRTSNEKFVDLIKYSPLWLFKHKVNSCSVCIKNEEAAKLLISPDYKDKLLIYTEKYIFDNSFFYKFLCKNGSKEQILEVAKSPFFSCTDIKILIKRFDDDFLELFFKKLKNPKCVSSYNTGNLVNYGYEKSLIAWLNSLNKTTEKNVFASWFDRRSFETLLCNSNLEKAKELYFDFPELSDVARLYIINSKNRKRIEQILKKQCNIDECIALLKTNDASLEMLAVKKYLENEYNSNDFINILLETGNLTTIKEYLKNKTLNEEKELLLVKNFDDEVIKFYVTENKNVEVLSNIAFQYVFDYKSKDLQDFLFLKMGLPYALERKLIKEGNEEKIRDYIEKNDLYDLNECLLMQTATKDVIEEYISRYVICDSAEVYLIRRGDALIINSYFENLSNNDAMNNRALSNEALGEFILTGNVDDVISYINSRNLFHSFVARNSLLRGDERLIDAVKTAYHFQEAIEEIAKEANPEVLIRLYSNPNIKFNERAQCNFCSREDIMQGTSDNLIVVRNFNDDIKFVKSSEILPPIAEFIKNHKLCAKAQELLFDDDLFNENVVRLYISLYELNSEVIKNNYNNPQFKNIFEEYIERHPLSDEIICSSII